MRISQKPYVYVEGDNVLTSGYYIVGKEDYFKMRKILDNFYYRHSQQEIDDYNSNVQQQIYKTNFRTLDDNKKDKVVGYVYFIVADGRYCKIGCTSNIVSRFKQMQTASPNELDLIGYIKTDDYTDLEIEAHNHFEKHKVRGEWFDISIEQIKEFGNRFEKEVWVATDK